VPDREVGSEFHWDPAALLAAGPADGSHWLPVRPALFATCCGALTSLIRLVSPGGRLHLPSFFCMGVAEALSADTPLVWYRQLPDERGPRMETLHADPGDIVVAQNLFGRDDREPWDAWAAAHPGVTVIEDHSHDPFSDWARTSTAAYATASLRKTLPVPDGGLLWSPRGLDLPEPAGGESPGAGLKLAAMLLKSAWLDGRAVPKDDFRALQQAGECALLGSAGPASTVTRAMLPLLDIGRLRATATHNVAVLATALTGPVLTGPALAGPVLTGPAPAARTGSWRVLHGAPAGSASFRVQLVCADEPARDALLRHLARHGIFAPVHWRQDRTGFWSGDDEAADLASRLLTVPVDHRCGPDDVSRIADVIRSFDTRAAEPPVRVTAAASQR
jgi:hypothetical protein